MSGERGSREGSVSIFPNGDNVKDAVPLSASLVVTIAFKLDRSPGAGFSGLGGDNSKSVA